MPGNILCSPLGGERVLVCHPHRVKFGSLQDLWTEISTAVYCRHPLCVCEIPTAILFPHLRVWMCWLPAGQWCGLRPSVLGQDRSETRKIRSWSCMLWSWSWSWSWSGYFGLGLASSDLGLRLKNLVLFTSLLWGEDLFGALIQFSTRAFLSPVSDSEIKSNRDLIGESFSLTTGPRLLVSLSLFMVDTYAFGAVRLLVGQTGRASSL